MFQTKSHKNYNHLPQLIQSHVTNTLFFLNLVFPLFIEVFTQFSFIILKLSETCTCQKSFP